MCHEENIFLEQPEVEKVVLVGDQMRIFTLSAARASRHVHLNQLINLFKLFFIYYLYKDAVSGCDYAASNQIISE